MRKAILFFLIFIFLLTSFYLLRKKPSLERNWSKDQKIVASITFKEEDSVHIKHIRNINYQSTKEYSLGYYDKSF